MKTKPRNSNVHGFRRSGSTRLGLPDQTTTRRVFRRTHYFRLKEPPIAVVADMEPLWNVAPSQGQERDFHHPYQPYKIQKQFMSALYDCIEDGKVGIFESPTGERGRRRSIMQRLADE